MVDNASHPEPARAAHPDARQPASAPARRLRIALAHDWLVGMRGGERVLEAIAAALGPDHDLVALYTMFDDGRPLSPHLDHLPKRVSTLGRLPGACRARRWMLPLYPAAVAGLSRRLARDHARTPIDLLISTSSAAIKGLRAPPGVPHLCYCHTPARYLWSQTDQYAGGLRGLGLKVMGPTLRAWDAWTSANVTMFLANSTHTAGEVRRCYGREAQVLFPPARTDFFTPTPGQWTGEPPSWLPPAVSPSHHAGPGGDEHDRNPFLLAVGAIEPYKRFDLAIEVARAAGASLVIAGDGSDLHRLKRMCGPNVTLVGRVSDEQLRELYRAAHFLVFPQVEDFGIVPVEAQACGCPVLARRAGGALDTVVDQVTGALFNWDTMKPPPVVPDGTPNPALSREGLLEAIDRVPDRVPETTAACRANAERFSEAAFAAGLRRAVERVMSRANGAG